MITNKKPRKKASKFDSLEMREREIETNRNMIHTSWKCEISISTRRLNGGENEEDEREKNGIHQYKNAIEMCVSKATIFNFVCIFYLTHIKRNPLFLFWIKWNSLKSRRFQSESNDIDEQQSTSNSTPKIRNSVEIHNIYVDSAINQYSWTMMIVVMKQRHKICSSSSRAVRESTHRRWYGARAHGLLSIVAPRSCGVRACVCHCRCCHCHRFYYHIMDSLSFRYSNNWTPIFLPFCPISVLWHSSTANFFARIA